MPKSSAMDEALSALTDPDRIERARAIEKMTMELRVKNYAGTLVQVRHLEQHLLEIRSKKEPIQAVVDALDKLLVRARENFAKISAEMTKDLLEHYVRVYGMARCALMVCEERATAVTHTEVSGALVAFPTCAEHATTFPEVV